MSIGPIEKEEGKPLREEGWLARFMAIWTGQAFSMIGSQLVQFALVWYLTVQTGSATVLALASMAAILPQVFLSPFAGAYVDRWKRRRVMIASDGLVALTTFSLVIMFALGQVEAWQIYIVMFARSCFVAFHWPASQAATTMLVPERHLTRVAGLNQALQGMAGILAPPLGAVLFAFLPMQAVLSVDIITAVLAIIPLTMIRFPEPVRGSATGKRVLDDLRDAFRFLRGWKGALLLISAFMLINMLLTPAFSLLPLLVLEHFQGGPLDYAALEAVSGIGMIAGGIVLGVWGGTKRRIVSVMASTALAGAGVTLLAFVPSNGILMAMGLLLFIGLMMPILNGSVMALMQACVPPGMQGRVFALMSALAVGAIPVGLAIGGPVADAIGILPWFIVSGVPMIILGAGGFLVPSIMNIESPSDRPAQDLQASEP